MTSGALAAQHALLLVCVSAVFLAPRRAAGEGTAVCFVSLYSSRDVAVGVFFAGLPNMAPPPRAVVVGVSSAIFRRQRRTSD